MSTSGALVFVVDGVEKTISQHADSDPDRLGTVLLSWLQGALADENGLRRRVAALTPAPDRDPTPTEAERYARFRDRQWRGDDGGRTWYALLHGTQGSPELILASGIFQDVPEKVRNAYWCAWAYLVDLDRRCFEVYQGSFPARPATRGRWAGLRGRHLGSESDQTFPVQRVAGWGFDDLPRPVGNWWVVD